MGGGRCWVGGVGTNGEKIEWAEVRCELVGAVCERGKRGVVMMFFFVGGVWFGEGGCEGGGGTGVRGKGGESVSGRDGGWRERVEERGLKRVSGRDGGAE